MLEADTNRDVGVGSAAEPDAIRFGALDDYLSRLPRVPDSPDTKVWLDPQGRVRGRYFNSTLTSAFQPIRTLSSNVVIGFEGFVRSYNAQDRGLCLWKLLDQAASDHESIELDRLCRMLHAINFYRQTERNADALFLSVHTRLLAAVEADHGLAFRRVLDALEIPHENIVLQLPEASGDQRWVLNSVSDNYRRNGFRLAFKVNAAEDAASFMDKARPHFIKLDAREIADANRMLHIVREAEKRGVQVIFKRVDSVDTLEVLTRLAVANRVPLHAQGFLWDIPKGSVAGIRPPRQEQIQSPVATGNA